MTALSLEVKLSHGPLILELTLVSIDKHKAVWSKDKIQQQTQSTYDAKARNQVIKGHIGGRCVLSSLHHP